MYKKVEHIGIAVKSIEKALSVYRDSFGLNVSGLEEVADQETRVAMLPVGDSRLELLEPTSDDGPVARFIQRRGEGIHHICFQVEDLETELRKLKDSGVRLIDEVPRAGADNCRVAFVHPSSTHGVLIELSQPHRETEDG